MPRRGRAFTALIFVLIACAALARVEPAAGQRQAAGNDGARRGAAAAADDEGDAAARAMAGAIAKAEAAYREAVIRAKAAYRDALAKELKRVMQAGDLDAANEIAKRRDAVEQEIEELQSGGPIKLGGALPATVAACGFNDASGTASDRKAGSPYKLDAPLMGQRGEAKGWAKPWVISDSGGPGAPELATVNRGSAVEGDGGLRLTQRGVETWIYRPFAKPLAGGLRIEQSVRAEREATGLGARPSGHLGRGEQSGPNWMVRDGEFRVLHGRGDGSNAGPMWKDTGIKCEPGTWYRVVLDVDVPSQTWTFAVNGETFDAGEPLGFRMSPKNIDRVDYLFGKEWSLDDVRVLETARPEAEPASAVGGDAAEADDQADPAAAMRRAMQRDAAERRRRPR